MEALGGGGGDGSGGIVIVNKQCDFRLDVYVKVKATSPIQHMKKFSKGNKQLWWTRHLICKTISNVERPSCSRFDKEIQMRVRLKMYFSCKL
jgi:hypothetical protein